MKLLLIGFNLTKPPRFNLKAAKKFTVSCIVYSFFVAVWQVKPALSGANRTSLSSLESITEQDSMKVHP